MTTIKRLVLYLAVMIALSAFLYFLGPCELVGMFYQDRIECGSQGSFDVRGGKGIN